MRPHAGSNLNLSLCPSFWFLLDDQVVKYADIMEMLTNYDYTIDYTSDSGGAAETWGPEAGYGIISASQMLRWVEANCREACGEHIECAS